MYPRAPSFMPGKCRTGHDLFTYLPMTQRGKSFLPDTSEALANLRASDFRYPRTPLKLRTLSRSSLRRIEPTRKILGYFRVPRTAGTSNTFEVLANFARFGTCAANKTSVLWKSNLARFRVLSNPWTNCRLCNTFVTTPKRTI